MLDARANIVLAMINDCKFSSDQLIYRGEGNSSLVVAIQPVCFLQPECNDLIKNLIAFVVDMSSDQIAQV